MYYLYILRSLKNHRLYTGLTKLFKLIYTERYHTRSAAYKREESFKTGQGREWLQKKIQALRATSSVG